MMRPLQSVLVQRQPSNRFLVRLPDRRMPRALLTVLVMGAAMVLVLSLIGWPRLKSTSIHYDLIRLRDDVSLLTKQEHSLSIELELERAPTRLEARAARLGLVPPGPLRAMSMSQALASAGAGAGLEIGSAPPDPQGSAVSDTGSGPDGAHP